MAITKPTVIVEVFCALGTSGTDYIIPVQTSGNPAIMTQDNGYPVSQSTPLNAGGVTVKRNETNGAFRLYSSILTWLQAGGTFTFESTVSTANTGYPAGQLLWSATNNAFQLSLQTTTANFVGTPSYLNDRVNWMQVNSPYSSDFNQELIPTLVSNLYTVKLTDANALLDFSSATADFTIDLPALTSSLIPGFSTCILDNTNGHAGGLSFLFPSGGGISAANFLVVAGGGAGGNSGVGQGPNGGNSSLTGGVLSIPVAIGGGSANGGMGNSGGSGAGAGGGTGGSGSAGTAGQGNNGGSSVFAGGGGGGGGSGGGGSGTTNSNGATGGAGSTWSINSTTYCGGGGGSGASLGSAGGGGGSGGGGIGGSSGSGGNATGFGSGGGGCVHGAINGGGAGGGAGGFVSSDALGSVALTSGTSYTVTVGSGGTGVSSGGTTSGNGSAGIVIISYTSSTGALATGGTITNSGTTFFHTFTTSGTFTVNTGTTVTMSNSGGYYKATIDANNNWYLSYINNLINFS